MKTDLDTMTGEQLNEHWHTLCRWRLDGIPKIISYWHLPDCDCERRHMRCNNGETGGDLPALHLDANLCIEALDAAFNKQWTVARRRDRTTDLSFFVYDGEFAGTTETLGPTFCIAALKALVRSTEK